MKHSVTFTAFFLLFFFDGSVSFAPDCSQLPGNWACSKNTDDTVNVTLDCNLNTDKSVKISLWSDAYPTNMKALTIKNCDKVLLINSLSFNDEPNEVLSDLQIVNVLKVTLNGYELHLEDPARIFRLPRKVLFKDIKLMKIKSELAWMCKLFRFNIDSVKFINLTLDYDYKTMHSEECVKELLMDTVSFSKTYPIYFYDKTATIKIINSTFHQIFLKPFNSFLTGSIDKLIVTGNSFKEISTLAFDLEIGSEFVFSGNKVENLPSVKLGDTDEKNWSVQSPVVIIEGNSFHFVGDYAFYGIKPPNSDENFLFYNFSNNSIREMTPRALGFESQKTYSNSTEAFNVSDNLIDCSCTNIEWFSDTFAKNDSRSLWFHDENPNKCFHIARYTFNQIIYNFSELCDLSRESATITLDKVYKDLLNDSKELSDSVKLLNEKVGDLLNGSKELSDSVKLLNEKVGDEHEELALLTVIQSSVIIFLILGLIFFNCSKNESLCVCAGRKYKRLESDESASSGHNSLSTNNA